MAKDPAFLFYTQDFQTGTQFFTDDQLGKYIRLLCAQHQHGHLPEKHMLSICKAYDEDILSKFKKDEQGRYYNERLDLEIERRKRYTKSRKDNALHPKKQKKETEAYAKHMETETEIETEIEKETINKTIVSEMLSVFKKYNPNYKQWKDQDFPALREIAAFICKHEGISFQPGEVQCQNKVLEAWTVISQYIPTDNFYQDFSLKSIKTNIQTITSKIRNGATNKKTGNGSAKITGTQINEAFDEFYRKGRAATN